MKITIAPSQDQHGERWPHSAVTIETPDDDMNLPRVLETLVIPALIAWQFPVEQVRQRIDCEDEDLTHGVDVDYL